MKSSSLFAAALFCLPITVAIASAQAQSPTVMLPAQVAATQNLRDLPQQREPTTIEEKIDYRQPLPKRAASLLLPDEVLQVAPGPLINATGGTHFDGLGSTGAAPSDDNMTVGKNPSYNYILQTVNAHFAIYTKSGGLILGPNSLSSLWGPLGPSNGCATNDAGDVVAQYDTFADRWLITQLGGTSAPYSECIAISQTPDPTGAYYLYSFAYGATLNDYPKFGIWPTAANSAYLATYNIFASSGSFSAGQLCAYDRAKMLVGDPSAAAICYNINGDGGFLPADLDGATAPLNGTPGYFLTYETLSSLRMYTLAPNFANPNASTLTQIQPDIAVAAFSEPCNGGGTCIAQSGTSQQLDSLGDRLMYRLAFRNFGDHEALVVNHSVTGGAGLGVRWYELRAPVSNTAKFTLYQQGTFAPADSVDRWMGSAAMDGAGNIGLGYSVSSNSIHPGVRYTGRIPSDPAGTMETEASILEGSGSQTAALDRWGDYTAMRIDPADDCTFWYTNQYLKGNGTFNWTTVIGSFRFGSCGSATAPDFSISSNPGALTLTQGQSGNSTVTVTSSNGFNSAVGVAVSGCPANATCSMNPTSVTPAANGSATSQLTVTTGSTTATGTFTLTIAGTGPTTIHSTTVMLTVNAAAAGTDLALGKPATQSSTLTGYGPDGASNAVDGNTDGNFAHGSVGHTNLDTNAWWQVDLGTSGSISSIAIWNRTDCCSDRLADYWVFVSNTPFAPTDTPATLQGRAGTWSSHQTSFPNPSTTIAVNAQGRYVRVQLSGSNYLGLAEVQVFGSSSGTTTFGISGQVTLSGAGLNGVTVTLSGSQSGSINTSGSGSYSFAGLAVAGTYTVTPSRSGYSFTPPSQTFSNLSASQTANFTASSSVTYQVSGQVTLSGAGLNGVTVTLSGSQSGSVNTSGSGNYSFTSLAAAGTYTVTPSLSGYSFTPPSQTFSNLSANQTANFTASAVTSNDLALGKAAAQSSTLTGYGPAGASNAVDGNTDGNFAHGSASHTNLDANAWWQVDLGAAASIGSIAIWNRTDCCGDRLSDYWVFVSNTPFAPSDTPATLQGRAGTWSSHQTSFPNPSTTIAVNTQGRYVRVQLSGSNYLALAEVQVFGSGSGTTTYGISGQATLSGAGLNSVTVTLSGSQSGSLSTSGSGNYSFTSLAAAGTYTVTPSLSGYNFTPPSQTFSNLSANQTANFSASAVAGGNLALGKAATQSSTLGGFGPTTVASSAVDGNTDGNFFDGSVSHTNNDANAWWQVDLGTAATVGSIAIWNRTDCCTDRLSDYWVFVSNTPFGPSDTPATLQGRAGTWSSHQTSFPNPSTTIAVNAPGRYVRVQLSGTNYLNLAEVQVFGH